MDDIGGQPGGDIARRAFDTVAAIQRVHTLEELNLAVQDSFRALGFAVWVGFDSVRVDGIPDVRLLFGNSHDAWQQHYKENGFDQHDAMIRASLSTNQPFFWSDVTARTTLSAAEQQVMNEASDFRLREGFVTPMHNLDGSITAILLTGDAVEKENPDVRAAAHLISMYFASVGRQLSRVTDFRPLEHFQRNRSSISDSKNALIREGRANLDGKPDSTFPEFAPAPVRLSQRQLDCLRWVREGKSAADIGQILGISPYTVQDHVSAACAKLGVRTRVQAVAEAAVLGLLEL